MVIEAGTAFSENDKWKVNVNRMCHCDATKQPGIAARLLVLCYAIGLLAVLLDARGAQTGKAVAVN